MNSWPLFSSVGAAVQTQPPVGHFSAVVLGACSWWEQFGLGLGLSVCSVYVLKSRATSVVNGRAFAVNSESVSRNKRILATNLFESNGQTQISAKGSRINLLASEVSECLVSNWFSQKKKRTPLIFLPARDAEISAEFRIICERNLTNSTSEFKGFRSSNY